MYPVRLGYETAKSKIKKLTDNGHHAESLVTSVFTVEKTLRRTLRQLLVSAGFKSVIADKIINKINGVSKLIESWELYDPEHRKLKEVVLVTDLKIITDASQLRNKMVHGEKVYSVDVCKAETQKILDALERVKTKFDEDYGYSGWVKARGRKVSKLHLDPKIKINGK